MLQRGDHVLQSLDGGAVALPPAAQAWHVKNV